MNRILVAGKGGVGKSFLTFALAEYLVSLGRPVIIVDADESNQSLHRWFGFAEPPRSILDFIGGKGAIKVKLREALRQSQGDPRVSIFNDEAIDLNLIPEEFKKTRDGITLISIGKIKEPLEGCACPMGVLAKDFLSKLTLRAKEYLIVDTEAGLEHFGRGLEQGVDKIIAVAEPYLDALEMAERIVEFGEKLQKKTLLIINKVMPSSEGANFGVPEGLRRLNKVPSIIFPFSFEIYEASLKGEKPKIDKLTKVLEKLVFLLE